MKNANGKSKSLIHLLLIIFLLSTIVISTPLAWSQSLEAQPCIEFNSTDEGDLGFHVELDGTAWEQIAIFDPTGKKIVHVKNAGSVALQGLTSLAFESAEPSLVDLSLDEFLSRFPEGEYKFIGISTEGKRLKTVAEFTHAIPDPPGIVYPAEGEVVDTDDVVIQWEPVTGPEGIEVDVYRVQLFPVDPPDGQEPIDLNIDLNFEVPSHVTKVPIDEDFLVPGQEYQIELTVVESGGNKSLTIGTFMTETDNGDDDEEDDD